MKKILLILPAVLLLTACGGESVSDNDSFKMETKECYSQCEEWGGGAENVSMCKKNCDASNDENSVWNDDEDKYNTEETVGSWPNDMPTEIPKFTLGKMTGNESGMGSWFADFENTPDSTLEDYKVALEDAGWSASIMSITNTLSGTLEGKYTIQVMRDPDYKNVQIMVRKVQK
ncbi:hypothetical protein JW758_02900 [Candidatus Peregrinibacteria bacterium]|nr:hypothetical protein [Candidatus Peregrinibacteria bacterium]